MTSILIPIERIERRILQIRGLRVMLDQDLGDLYEVPTRALVQAVKRNLNRFPEDFMFQLSADEFKNLRSQFVTSSWGGRRYAPYAFTEHGVAMLSSVLNSDRAVAVNIEIIRAFARLRQLLSSHTQLSAKLRELEARMTEQDWKLTVVFDAIRQLMTDVPSRRRKPPIGYATEAVGRKRVKKRGG
jgi:hypothetical protein